MTEMSRRFNFDDFDEQCREAIEDAEHTELDAKLCLEGIALALSDRWPDDTPSAPHLTTGPEAA